MVEFQKQSELIWTIEVRNPNERADRAILHALMMQEAAPPHPRFQALTRTQLQRLMHEGQVTDQGKPVLPSDRLPAITRIQITLPPPRPSQLIPENRALDILFEDESVLVLNKPPQLTVHPSSTQWEGTLVQALLHHDPCLSEIGGVLRPGIVHRIDKNTSGVLVVTKTNEAHLKLSKQFANHTIQRCYWALCYGVPLLKPLNTDLRHPSNPPSSMTIESLIGRHPIDRKKMSMQVKRGKSAISVVTLREGYAMPHKQPFASWVEIQIKTGRTHQVRVHLAGIGASILGDPVYGTPTPQHTKWTALPAPIQKAVKLLPGQALHARLLGFRHPVTEQFLLFEADPPPEFLNVWSLLQHQYLCL